MNNRSELHRTKRNFLQKQIQIASNNIQFEIYTKEKHLYFTRILDIHNIV